jgi:hypothetical protein
MIKLSLLRPSFFRKWARSQVWLEYEYIGKHIVLGPVPYMYRSGFRLDDGGRMDDRREVITVVRRLLASVIYAV